MYHDSKAYPCISMLSRENCSDHKLAMDGPTECKRLKSSTHNELLKQYSTSPRMEDHFLVQFTEKGDIQLAGESACPVDFTHQWFSDMDASVAPWRAVLVILTVDMRTLHLHVQGKNYATADGEEDLDDLALFELLGPELCDHLRLSGAIFNDRSAFQSAIESEMARLSIIKNVEYESPVSHYNSLHRPLTNCDTSNPTSINSEHYFMVKCKETLGLNTRIQALLPFYIEGASVICDIEDPRWSFEIMFDRQLHVPVAYCSCFDFFKFPDGVRRRISQFWVLPLHQRRHLGSLLYARVMSRSAGRLRELGVGEVTVEDPCPAFTQFRLCNDFMLARQHPDVEWPICPMQKKLVSLLSDYISLNHLLSRSDISMVSSSDSPSVGTGANANASAIPSVDQSTTPSISPPTVPSVPLNENSNKHSTDLGRLKSADGWDRFRKRSFSYLAKQFAMDLPDQGSVRRERLLYLLQTFLVPLFEKTRPYWNLGIPSASVN